MTNSSTRPSRHFQIGDIVITDDSLPFVIAEIGNNHQGDVEIAKQMIRAAAFAGASAVKFQKRDNRTLFTQAGFDAPYASENAFGPTYGTHREALEFGKKEYLECIEEAKRNNIMFFATPFDQNSVGFLEDLDIPLFKIASADLRTLPLLREVARLGKPVIVSTGGGTFEDVDRAAEIVLSEGAPLAFMQCTSGYPPRFDELNLKVIESFRERYPQVTIGYSGHDSGIAMSLVAYVLGARIIEKHFTDDQRQDGPDHHFSMTPETWSEMVQATRDLEQALGTGKKLVEANERETVVIQRRCLRFSKPLKQGHKLSREDIIALRPAPAGAFTPDSIEIVVGLTLSRDVEHHEAISPETVRSG
jgi:N-acetylneuraminate synthase/sialic acid synthase